MQIEGPATTGQCTAGKPGINSFSSGVGVAGGPGPVSQDRHLPFSCNLRDNNDLPRVLGFNRKGNQFQVLIIRLARIGARKQPYYRVVVIEKERARNGRSVEVVGLYNPRTTPATIDVKRDRIDYWVSKGAQLSDTVRRLLSKTPAETGTAA